MVFFKITRLKYYDGNKVEEYKPKSEVKLVPGLEMCMNRSKDKNTHITLISHIASRRHAVIVHRRSGVVEVKDLNSGNGTYINGQKISENQWTPLKINDVLSIGLDYYTTDFDEDNYFFKLVYDRSKKRTVPANDTKPICDIDSSSVNNTTCLVKDSSVNEQTSSNSPIDKKLKKEDLKRRRPITRSEHLEQPPPKKALIDNQIPPKKSLPNMITSKDNKRKSTKSSPHVLSERNSKSSLVEVPKLRATQITKLKHEGNKLNTVPSENKSHMFLRQNRTEKTYQPKAVLDSVLDRGIHDLSTVDPQPYSTQELYSILDSQVPPKTEPNVVSNFKLPSLSDHKVETSTKNIEKINTIKNNHVESMCDNVDRESGGNEHSSVDPEPYSTQELHSILDSQAVPENFLKTESIVDFNFKVPSLNNQKRQSDITKNASHLVEYFNKNLEIAPSSTQELKNILMDSQESSTENPSAINKKLLKKNATKKFFKTVRSPSKKPKFNTSFEAIYNFGSAKKNITSKHTKREITLKNMSGSSLSKAFKSEYDKTNSKSWKQKSSQKQQSAKKPESPDHSKIVCNVESMSQYSLTEDDVVEILYDDSNLVETSDANMPATEEQLVQEATEDDQDIGWLKEMSQSIDDSYALVIHEKEDENDGEIENTNLPNSSPFAFIKQAEVLPFDEEDITTKVDKIGNKSIEDLQDKIKLKYSAMSKNIELIEPPVINPDTSRRSKRNSGNVKISSKPSSTLKSRNSSSTNDTSQMYADVNKTGLLYYCRALNESPKYIKTRNSRSTTKLQSEETKVKPKRQVNFHTSAQQVNFDVEDTSSSVMTSEKHSIKLNTKPSLSKLKSMESQSIKQTLSAMHKNNALVELGDNVHFLCWFCSWLPQQMTMSEPPPVFKGYKIEDLLLGKKSYVSIDEFYHTIEPLLYYQTWKDMSSQYARDRKPRQFSLHRDSIDYDSDSSFYSSRSKKLFRLKCSIKNISSKWLTVKQILLLTFNPVSTRYFECFAYVTHIDKLSNESGFNLQITLSVVSEKELTTVPTSLDINAQIMTKVDINHYKSLLRRSVGNDLTSMFLKPESVEEPPVVRMRDMLENVGTCTLKQKHVVSTFLDVCLERERKLVLVDALAGSGKTVAIVKAIENLLLYTDPPNKHRILILGSNVGSLDEVSSQLINLRKSLPSQAQKKRLKFLRLDDSHDTEVRTYSCSEFVQSELKRFKKEALEKPAVLKQTRQEIVNQMKSEPNEASPYYLTLKKALNNADEYPKTELLSKEFLLYFFKTQKLHLIDGADIVCCNLKELCNVESCNYINLNKQRKCTVCIIEDANLCTDLDLSLLLQLHIDKLVLIGDSTVDVILPFPCLYERKLHLNLFKRLIQAKTVSHKQMIPVIELNEIHRGTTTLRHNIKKVFRLSAAKDAEPKGSKVGIMEWCLISHKFEGGAEMANDRTVRVKACDQEATLVVNIATQVKNKYPRLSVVIITPFDVQKSTIMKILSNKDDQFEKVHIFSVADFIGRQADVVIFSTKLPYDLTSNVMEIVFTRARTSLIIVGNFSTNYPKSYTGVEWAKALEISKSTRTLRPVPAQFDLSNEKLALDLILKR